MDCIPDNAMTTELHKYYEVFLCCTIAQIALRIIHTQNKPFLNGGATQKIKFNK